MTRLRGRFLCTLFVFAAFWLCTVGSAAAQTCSLPSTAPDVTNPSAVQWCPSPDHALVDSYELDILRPDNSVLQTLNLGKPAVSATDGSCTASINVQPIAFGVGYATRIRAKASTAVSADNLSLNKFTRAPGAPSKLIEKEPEPVPEWD